MNAVRLEHFAQSLLVAAGSDTTEASAVARALVWCDSVGRPNQGVWRLPILCERLSRGVFETPCTMQVEMKSSSVAVIDGGAGQGHYVASRAMEKAIKLAQAEGISAVAVNNSNFFGAGGYYAAMAPRADLIGIALSNSFPKVLAYQGKLPVLGTNPLAFACPARDNEPLVLDMATSALAGSTLRRQQEDGDPAQPASTTVIEPWAAAKGYGMALMVEIMSGVLSGAGFSHQVHSMYEDLHHSGNNGHFFLALDIGRFMPLAVFRQRMLTLIEFLEASGDNGQVGYPGENRWEALKKSQAEGIHLDEKTRTTLEELADKYRVTGP